ncbi:zinc ribbon domain-containing protein [Motilimonas sp. KMU-193]|uniref:zinc ribbon domain-containing protein n=1 Tax=Motilimonas sp. KMU-193 TaxID=3388668 RepID=UPI00396AF496
MKALACPSCNEQMNYLGKFTYHCEKCDKTYQAQVHCDKCGERLELLKACGAVDFFCNSCNEMKSKSSADYRLSELAQ